MSEPNSEPSFEDSDAPTADEADTYWASAAAHADPNATAWSGAEPGSLAAADPLVPGQSFGEFQIVEELGRGGMGIVYRALDGANRAVALKVILTSRRSSAARERFEREGQVAASLRHPGIVGVLSAGELNGQPYLVYELVEGGRSLKAAWAGEPLEEKARRLVDAARALGHAHAQGVVHRDVKPDNLLVDAHDTVRVSDFGLAAGADLEQLTQTGTRLGTPTYMAPEQVGGLRELQGPSTDVWALGVILYEALTGERPFAGSTLDALFLQILKADPALPRTLDATVDPGLEAVCLKALQADPGERYADANALADDLERALQGEGVRATRVRPWARALVRQRRSLVVGAALLVLATTALLVRPFAAQREVDVHSPRVSLEAPLAGQVLSTRSLEVVGVAEDESPWVEVWVEGHPRQRVEPGARFRFRVELAAGAHTIAVRSIDAAGNLGRPIRRAVRVVSGARPEWFARAAPSKRPRLPLPDGLSFGQAPRTYRWSKDGSVLVWVPPGTFLMGGATTMLRFDQDRGRAKMELPQIGRRVQITRGYFIGKYEVTYAQFHAFQRAIGEPITPPPTWTYQIEQKQFGIDKHWRKGKRKPEQLGLDHPLVDCLWKDAQRYLRWAGLRLPTEAEWEYAARGEDGRSYPWGEDPPSPKLLNALGDEDGYYYTAPVTTFPAGASPFGCLQMAGNAAEMVSDRWEPFADKASVDPQGPAQFSGKRAWRVNRGGGFYFRHSATFHTAMRARFEPRLRHRLNGFRVVLRPPAQPD